MSDWRAFWSMITDPYGYDRAPAGNPRGASIGDFPDAHGYSPPSYTDDIAQSQRTPLRTAVEAAPPQAAPEVNGVGGPVSAARDIIQNAPRASQAETEAQAMRDAMAAARAQYRTEPMPYNEDRQWVQERDALERARALNQRAQAELARRESVSFEDWWRFGGRQSGDWTPDQPAYRFSRLPPDQRQDNRRRLGARR